MSYWIAANRRQALDRLATYFIGDLTQEEAETLLEDHVDHRPEPDRHRAARGQGDYHLPQLHSAATLAAGFAVMEMVYRLRREYQIPVTMIVTGVAYSMAAVVLQAASHRVMGELSTLMLHSPSWVLTGKDAQIFQDYERLAGNYRQMIGRIFTRRTGYKDASVVGQFHLFPARSLPDRQGMPGDGLGGRGDAHARGRRFAQPRLIGRQHNKLN